LQYKDFISKKDYIDITRKAKEMCIPVAFLGKPDSDNMTVSFRTSDQDTMSKILDDLVKEKITERPETLSCFDVAETDIEGLQAELRKNDLAADFTQNEDGSYSCVYAKEDKRAFDLIKADYKKLHEEVVTNTEITAGNGYTTVKDLQSGREISFDGVMQKSELSETLQTQFGYDPIKANIAANKYGQGLTAEEQQKFFDKTPEVDKLKMNIKLENENPICKNFVFAETQLKTDGIARIAIVGKDGAVAALDQKTLLAAAKELEHPALTTLAEGERRFTGMLGYKLKGVPLVGSKIENALGNGIDNVRNLKDTLRTQLGISDNETLAAVLDKAVRVAVVNEKNSVANQNYSIHGEDKIGIERKSKDAFTVDMNGKQISFNFNDKKAAVAQLTAEIKQTRGGAITDNEAKKHAETIYKKAKSQSADKFVTARLPNLDKNGVRRGNDKLIGIEILAKTDTENTAKISTSGKDGKAVKIDLSKPVSENLAILQAELNVSPEKAAAVLATTYERAGLAPPKDELDKALGKDKITAAPIWKSLDITGEKDDKGYFLDLNNNGEKDFFEQVVVTESLETKRAKKADTDDNNSNNNSAVSRAKSDTPKSDAMKLDAPAKKLGVNENTPNMFGSGGGSGGKIGGRKG
jgi:hypothetical protein